jgi:hypothetical protein
MDLGLTDRMRGGLSSKTCFCVLALTCMIAALTPSHGGLFVLGWDRWGDFIKVALTFPGPPIAAGPFPEVVAHYAASHDYGAFDGVLPLTPFSTALSIAARQWFGFASPIFVYLALAFALLAALSIVLIRETDDLVWPLVALVSYPLLTVFDRGNLFTGLCATCLIAALLRQRADWAAAIMVAIAINIRPNAVICTLPLLMLDWRLAPKLALVAAALFLVSLGAATILYPPYGIASFSRSLGTYFRIYVERGVGVPFGSSLYGAFYALGWRGSYGAATVIGFLPLAAALSRRWSYDERVFLSCAAMALSTTIFGDYHLLVFLAPLILARSKLVAIPSLAILMPKGVIMLSPMTSIQVVLNPALMLCAAGLIIGLRLIRRADPHPLRATETSGGR